MTSTSRGLIQTAVITAGVLAAALHCGAAHADSATRCKALEIADFSGIQDAPTQVMEAELVAAAGDVPAHCHVQGYISPSIGIELQMPAAQWNGKFIEIGCGGFCGMTTFKRKLYLGWCDESLRRGYACIVSNQGHTSTKEGYGNVGSDGLWAYDNLQAEADFGFRAGHVTALAGKAITAHYYDAAPKFSYFMGCSNGGRQAMVEAQRFPWDFDGIISMEPVFEFTGGLTSILWNFLATTGSDGKPLFTPAEIGALHSAAIAQCDLDDGLQDGVIGNPRSCQFAPAQLLCRDSVKSGCLSAVQVAAANKVYRGPMTSKGAQIYPGVMLGGENGTSFATSGSSFFTSSFFRYMAFMPDAGPRWNPRDFNFDSDAQRLGMMASFYDATNPDMRKFKAAGGKLIMIQGWDDDGLATPLRLIDYYETVERTMGGRGKTQEFARLFMVPGRSHCGFATFASQNPASASAIDHLGYLEAWVEQGRAPDMIVSSHLEIDKSIEKSRENGDFSVFIRAPTKAEAKVKFTRPVYPYPVQARYKGTGDRNDYRSFEPSPVGQK